MLCYFYPSIPKQEDPEKNQDHRNNSQNYQAEVALGRSYSYSITDNRWGVKVTMQ